MDGEGVSGSRSSIGALALLAAAIAAGCATAHVEVGDAVIARYSGGTVSCEELLLFDMQTPPQRRLPAALGDDHPLQYSVIEDLVTERVLAEEATIMGTWQSGATRQKWETTRRKILLTAIEDDLKASVAISPEAVARHYSENSNQFAIPERVGSSLIMLHLEPDAGQSEVASAETRLREIRQEHLNGTPFGELARRHSEAENAARGGAVAASPRGALLPAFEEVAWRLPPGQVSDVVRLHDGLALIRVDTRFPAKAWSLDEARDIIVRRLERAEIEEKREQILAQAADNWPAVIDWDAVFDPAVSEEKPVLFVATRAMTLGDLGLASRPPRLRQAINAGLSEAWLLLWAEEQGFTERTDVAVLLRQRQQRLMAATALNHQVNAALPEVPEVEQRELYERLAATLEEPEERRFLVVFIEGQKTHMRTALATARQIEAAWRGGGNPPNSRHVAPWGPISRSDLSNASSPLLAKTAFSLSLGEISPPLLMERYTARSRFQPEGYVVLRLEEVTPSMLPDIDEVREELEHRLLRDQITSLRRQIRHEILDGTHLSIDADAVHSCTHRR